MIENALRMNSGISQHDLPISKLVESGKFDSGSSGHVAVGRSVPRVSNVLGVPRRSRNSYFELLNPVNVARTV